ICSQSFLKHSSDIETVGGGGRLIMNLAPQRLLSGKTCCAGRSSIGLMLRGENRISRVSAHQDFTKPARESSACGTAGDSMECTRLRRAFTACVKTTCC